MRNINGINQLHPSRNKSDGDRADRQRQKHTKSEFHTSCNIAIPTRIL